MKYLLLVGGSLGFAVVFIGGWIGGHDPLSMVIEASFGCLIAAVLFRWLGNLTVRSVQAAVREREAASRERTLASEAETVSSTQSQAT